MEDDDPDLNRQLISPSELWKHLKPDQRARVANLLAEVAYEFISGQPEIHDASEEESMNTHEEELPEPPI